MPFIATCLFVAHPLHTEVVANIKGRDEILCLLFALLSLFTLHGYVQRDSKVSLGLAALSFFLALLSKETAITWLAVFPLVVYFFSNASAQKQVAIIVLMCLVAAAFLLIRKSVLGTISPGEWPEIGNFLVGVSDPAERVATAVYVLGRYLRLLIFPHPLAFDYSVKQIPVVGPADSRFLLSFALYAAMTVYAFRTLKRREVLSFAILFYLVTFSLTSNTVVLVGVGMAERLTYVPSLGFCLALAVLLCKLFRADLETRLGQPFETIGRYAKPLVLLAILLAAYSVRTAARNRDWKDNATLYLHDVNVVSNSAAAHFYAGVLLMSEEFTKGMNKRERSNSVVRGVTELQTATRLFPKFADAWNEIGVAHFKAKEYDLAKTNYLEALRLDSNNSSYHKNYGMALFATGQYQEALREYHEAIKSNPRSADAYGNLGMTYLTLKNYDSAAANFTKAIECDPASAQAYYFLGMTYRFKGDEANAMRYINKAQQLDPALKK